MTATSDENWNKWNFQPPDKDSFTPMYFQIEAQLLEIIQSGKVRPGDLLPSEGELSRMCKVSRMTSRQALQGLKTKGFVTRRRGQGSIVNQPRVEKDITHLSGFSTEMRALGINASSKVLEQNVIPASAEIAAQLGIDAGEKIFLLRRLRLGDGVPVAIEVTQIPLKRFPGIEKMDFSSRSLYSTFHENFGIRLSRADEVLEARSATRAEAKLLGVQFRSSVLAITRTIWSTDGLPLEMAQSAYRGDRYRAVIRIPATEME
ncbi:MAG: GntR family transcriptional regulator [Terracidiphilus sp.]